MVWGAIRSVTILMASTEDTQEHGDGDDDDHDHDHHSSIF